MKIQISLRILLLSLAVGVAFGQTPAASPQGEGSSGSALPPGLRAIFASRMASQLAAADTVTVSITAGGVVPVYSTATTIQSGEWVSIYGQNLAPATAIWNGDFPLSLGGVSVTIDGKAAPLWFVSSGQINLQVPDDPGAAGTVPVTVTNANGTANSTVTMGQFGPSFSLLGDNKHAAGIIFRTDGSGAYAGGAYDIIGPTGSSLGFATKAAKAGDVIELFGVGFGPTDPPVPAGQAFSGAAKALSSVQISLGGANVPLDFAGITGAGLFQFNLKIPSGLGSGDVALVGQVGGVQSPGGVVIAVQ